MAVDAEETRAHVQAQMERRHDELVARAERARGIARALAASLVELHGATRVLLHGSLARGQFHERSDIDLTVEGLSPAALLEAGVALDESAAPFNLDLISLDRLPDGLRSRIEAQGIPLP